MPIAPTLAAASTVERLMDVFIRPPLWNCDDRTTATKMRRYYGPDVSGVRRELCRCTSGEGVGKPLTAARAPDPSRAPRVRVAAHPTVSAKDGTRLQAQPSARC